MYGYLTVVEFFAVKNGTIYTPVKDEHILGSTTRDTIMELLKTHQIPLQEIAMTPAFLEAADEVWISGSTREVIPVVALNGLSGMFWHMMVKLY